MKIIDADKFLSYLIFSKHIDGLTCGEVKEAVEMSKVDVLDKIRAEIEETYINITYQENKDRKATWGLRKALDIINKYKAEIEPQEKRYVEPPKISYIVEQELNEYPGDIEIIEKQY